ncbi:MAG TPA: ATP-binding protein [Syntrophales bacterium]|nr:ATP-binding protein [Syntrophales bacterium]
MLKLTIFSRLIIGSFLIILLVGISGVYTIMSLNDLNQLIESIIKNDSRIIKLAEEALDDLYSLTAAEDKYLISRDPDYYQQFKNTRSDFTKRVDELEKIADTEVKTGLLTEIKKFQGLYDVLIDERKSLTVQEKNNQTYVIDREMITREIDQKLRNLVRVSTEDRNTKLQRSKDMSTQIINVFNISLFLAVILVIIITFFNTRKINLPINQLSERAKEVAGGKFGDPLKISSPPEIKELADTFNMMCERLKELDQMKIDYISHLSHELRTPLTVIKEASSMLQEGVFSKVPEKQEDLFVLIKAECERLILSVNRILDFSRMEAGKMFFSFQNASLRPIIEKNILKLSPLIQKKKMDITLEIPEDIPSLRMDKERIEEVFENLLSNALKFTMEGGKITVSVKNNSENNTVEISVSDNGRGIPEDGLMQVFDKFKRVDDKRGAIRGTGMGLAIVRHIINAHGGRIWVKSKVGEGSTFTFSLPAL